MDKQIMNVQVENIKSIKNKNNNIGCQVYLLLKGSCRVLVDNVHQDIFVDDFFILNHKNKLSIDTNQQCIFLIISLDENELNRLINKKSILNLVNFPSQSRISAINKELVELLYSIMNEYIMKNVSFSRSLELTLRLFNCLNKNFKEEYSFELVDNHVSRVDSIKQYIEDNYQEDITLQTMAEYESLTYSYLSRYFKENIGTTFKKYLTMVRLEHAVIDLIYTDQSIIEISIKNGFWNQKTFSKNFKQRFKISPIEYRKKYREDNYGSLTIFEIQSKTLNNKELMNLLTKYSINSDSAESSWYEKKYISLDTQKKVKTKQNKNLILNIGWAENILNYEFKQQIEDIQKEIGFDYVRLFGIGLKNCLKSSSQIIPTLKNIKLIFQCCIELKLIPIVQVKIEDLNSDFFKALDLLKDFFSEEVVSNWKIEIDIASFYEADKNYLKYIEELINSKFGKLGIYFDLYSQKELIKIETWLRKLDISICFLSFDSDLNNDYSDFYLKERIQQLTKIFSESIEIYINDWNTVSGDNFATVGTFFRVALTLRVLQDNQITATSFWLNIEARLSFQKKLKDSSLSLFVYSSIKRPIYFLLEMLKKIKGEQIYFNKNYSLYKDKKGDFYLLLSNPLSINPDLSISYDIMSSKSILIDCTLMNLSNRHYEVHSYFLDKDHGGTYNEWMKMGGILSLDNAFLENLSRNIHPEYTVSYPEIDNGEIKFNYLLTFNSVLLLHIRSK